MFSQDIHVHTKLSSCAGATALAADYINLYYVDLETEQFTEYTSDARSAATRSIWQGYGNT